MGMKAFFFETLNPGPDRACQVSFSSLIYPDFGPGRKLSKITSLAPFMLSNSYSMEWI